MAEGDGLDPNVDWGFVSKMLERWPGYAYLASNPEIRDLLVSATREEWAPELFEAKLRATAWWQTTSSAVRQWGQLEATDGATAARQVNATKQTIAQLAGTLGGSLDDNTLGGLAWQYHRQGWSDQTLRMQVANLIKPGTGQMQDVEGLASRYLIDITDGEAQDYTRRMFTGELNEATLRGIFQQRALAKFPTLAEQMKAGATPADYFADYTSMISRYTDTPVSAIDLVRDPTWSQILSYNDNGTIRPMTIAEATKHVRSTDAFANSMTGKAEAASYVDTLTKALGARR